MNKTMVKSAISNENIPLALAVRGSDLRENLLHFIQSKEPDFPLNGYLSVDELNDFRRSYIATLMLEEKGALAKIDRDVMEAIKNNSVLTENIQDKLDTALTFGQRMADGIATFGGSWTFIITFFLFLAAWIALNVWFLGAKRYDPYPFILLNLILSCLAAIQAPIIMMSQNRQEQKDRDRAEHDYKINLKAELEIKLLGEKIDHLLVHQNKKLLEIQEMQVDYMNDLFKKLEK